MARSLRVALAQLNVTVGDVAGNADLVEAAHERARAADADLVVCSELALLGYPPRDLLSREAAVERQLDALDRVAAATADGPALVVGIADPVSPPGRALANAAAVCRDGEVVARVAKRLLPTYDVFDEDRYFEPGAGAEPVEVAGVDVGASVCEDAWNLPDLWSHPRYDADPLGDLASAGADLLVNVSGSPFHLGKGRFREELMGRHAAEHGRWLAFVNQVGGNDELVFDGGSFVVGPDGGVACRCAAFEEDLRVCDVPVGGGPFEGERDCAPRISDRAEQARRAIALGVRDYVRKSGFEDVVLGLSGGIDSSVAACLAAEALGAEHVLGVAMPARYTSDASTEDARAVADALGIDFQVLPIDDTFGAFLDHLAPPFEGEESTEPMPGTVEENVQARIRGTTLMALANAFDRLVLTPDNKSEAAVGYCTLYGDTVGALAPLGDCRKGLVYDLADRINADVEPPGAASAPIPRRVVERPPSAELRPDQRDEDDLPPYAALDPIVEGYVEEGASARDLVDEGHDPATVERVLRMLHRAEYKRWQVPPIVRLTPQAFGIGWRYPLAARYEALWDVGDERSTG
ncbi:NAD+ synthase [Halomarina pelagica]|uniref:NAD+ synthase n=1 Tax=Halomarina pelagica TaxID=2961599 RepID=UPI0020C582C6|nr:NAD+ synthase [Halomarina sp. BND7]